MSPAGTTKFIKFGMLVTGCMVGTVPVVVAEPSQFDVTEAVSLPTPAPTFVNTADLVVETAEEVVTDVQSVLFGSRFQRGKINGFSYVLFPDGSAKVYDIENPRNVVSTMQCTEGVECRIEGYDGSLSKVVAIDGPKPDVSGVVDASDVADHLAAWVLAGTGTAPALPEIIEEPIETVPSEILEPTLVVASENTLATDDVSSAPLDDEDTKAEGAAEPIALATAQIVTETAAQQTILDEAEDCPEQGQFVPTACAQPAVSTVKPALPTISPIAVAPRAAVVQAPVEIDPAPLSFTEQYKVKCSLTGSATLSYENANNQMQRPGKPRVSLGCSASLTDELSVRVALIRYVHSEEQEDWDPDFTYAFNYRFNDTVSLGYSNYSGRLSAPNGGLLDALSNGNLRASFRFPKVTLPNEKDVACSASLRLPNPIDASANLSCGYSVTSKLRIGGTASFYLPDKQGEYDPDFSYTANYRVAENWLVSYSNYSNNRWAWNPSESPGSGFGGGTISATYSIKF